MSYEKEKYLPNEKDGDESLSFVTWTGAEIIHPGSLCFRQFQALLPDSNGWDVVDHNGK